MSVPGSFDLRSCETFSQTNLFSRSYFSFIHRTQKCCGNVVEGISYNMNELDRDSNYSFNVLQISHSVLILENIRGHTTFLVSYNLKVCNFLSFASNQEVEATLSLYTRKCIGLFMFSHRKYTRIGNFKAQSNQRYR